MAQATNNTGPWQSRNSCGHWEKEEFCGVSKCIAVLGSYSSIDIVFVFDC